MDRVAARAETSKRNYRERRTSVIALHSVQPDGLKRQYPGRKCELKSTVLISPTSRLPCRGSGPSVFDRVVREGVGVEVRVVPELSTSILTHHPFSYRVPRSSILRLHAQLGPIRLWSLVGEQSTKRSRYGVHPASVRVKRYRFELTVCGGDRESVGPWIF